MKWSWEIVVRDSGIGLIVEGELEESEGRVADEFVILDGFDELVGLGSGVVGGEGDEREVLESGDDARESLLFVLISHRSLVLPVL